jgi:rhodanese-related sulfurtransferase
MNISAAAKLISAVNGPAEFQWIDVRSPGEFSAGHIPGAVNIPMEQIESRIDDLLPGVPIVLICQAGKRARLVAGLLEPCRKDLTVLEGGTAAWNAAGLPLVTSVKSRFSLERQVRLIAGILVLTSVLLSLALSQSWIYLAAAVGTGLTFAGLTDICLMAGLLVRLPWNQARTGPPVNRQACSL